MEISGKYLYKAPFLSVVPSILSNVNLKKMYESVARVKDSRAI
jgi:hypothetical protein